MSVNIIDSRGAWPFPAVTKAYREGRTDWVEVDEERYDYCLGVLPPIYFRGGFFVSEPAAHTDAGEPVYTAAAVVNGRYFLRDVPRSQGEAAVAELRELLS